MGGPRNAIEVAPLQSEGVLSGFLLSGRWPDDLVEWSKVLALTVRMAAVPGLLRTTTVFRVSEESLDDPAPRAVGLVLAEGTLVGPDALEPGSIHPPQPLALLVLHPPTSTVSSVPDHEVASGCILPPPCSPRRWPPRGGEGQSETRMMILPRV